VSTGQSEIRQILFVNQDEGEYIRIQKDLARQLSPSVRVDHARDAEEALHKLVQKSYDLLIIDSAVDPSSGIRFVDEVRRRRISMPFVLMTPVWDDQLVREAIKAGVADVLVKSEEEYGRLAGKLLDCYHKFYGIGHAADDTGSAPESDGLAGAPAAGAGAPSIKDELTGLYNHSYLHERVVREFSRATRYHYPVSCLMVDIDHFKDINEEHGYGAGDKLLKESAQMLFAQCRLGDLIARYGGEEFCVILPHIDYIGALDLARRLRTVFAKSSFVIEGREINVTVSIGISCFPEDPIKRRGDLLSFATNALSQSKAAGRNRVTLYREMTPLHLDDMPEIKISQEKISEFQRRISESAETARRSYVEASITLIKVLESKDSFTAGHAARCSKYAREVALTLGMGVDDAEVVQHAALLHDIGKICIPDEILLKPSRLTFSEFETMKQHSYLGYKILKPIKFLREEAQYVLHHHEWFNGEGYPCHLKGDDIPLGSRIISVTDSYDTMRTAGARYKDTCGAEMAVNELIACAGTQFDPEVVKAFVEVLKTRGELISPTYHADRLDKILREHRQSL
jgi:diguanylate cyclase (GGDEF)-like protein/putative nucleotidyltransferase with HDIG domain